MKAHADEFLGNGAMPAGFQFVLDPDLRFVNGWGPRWDAPGETSYPSSFVVDRGGVVRFVKVSRAHDGRATADELLAAARR